MSFSRFIFSASKHRSTDSFNLIQRFCHTKRFQYRNYGKSTSPNNAKTRVNPMMNVETPAPRSPMIFVVPGLIGIAGLMALVHYNDERRSIPKGQCGSNPCNTGNCPAIGGPFKLIDMNKQPVTEKDFLGNWVLLYFGYTSSPDVGPEQLQLIAKAVDILGSKDNLKILPVFITLDPQRDSPAQLRAYLKDFDPKIVGLTGPVNEIRRTAQEYRVFFRKNEEVKDDYLVESSHNMYLLNPKMEVVRCIGLEYNADHLSESILEDMKRNQM